VGFVSQVAAEQMCRLVVCGPSRNVDIAVPAQAMLTDLLPVFLRHAGEGQVDAGLAHSGWVVQRLGEPPLDESATIAALGLHDGDVLHLVPRAQQLPAIAFDDLVDGVATGLRERAGRWRPEMVRWAAVGVTGLALAAGQVSLLLPGPPLPRFACVAMALVTLLAAIGARHGLGERGFSIVFALAAVSHAGVAGLIVVNLDAADGAPQFGPVEILCASAAAGVTAVLVLLLLDIARPLVSGCVVGAALAAVSSGPAIFLPIGTAGAAGIAIVAGTLATALVPVTAFRLAGLRLDPLPTAPEHIQEDIDPEPAEPLLSRAELADRYMTALYAGPAVVVAAGMVVLGRESGWAPATLVGLTAMVRMLAARPMTSAWHRLALAGPALCGITAMVLAAISVLADPANVLFAVAVVPAIAIQAVIVARTLPRRRPTPYWGRLGDILQTLCTVALLPVLLAVLDVYGFVRGIGG
jgi:type VII secretion integral membrane protein EccD